jgi:transposase
VNSYFRTSTAPFSKAQYYNYLKCLKEYGENGLSDKREKGHNRKLTESIKDYITTCVEEQPSISASEIGMKIQKRFDANISRSGINDFRKSRGLVRQPPSKNEYESQRSGGGEILTGLAFFSGIIESITRIVVERINEVRKTSSYAGSQSMKKDHPSLRMQGKFTKEYNRLESVRKNRFKSIDEKIPKKNYSSMSVFRMSEKTISRYNLALLCLPLVTNNGKSSRVNRVKGNDLEFLCGYNYKDAALDKYLRELKYLKVSEKLISETARFWMEFWRVRDQEDTVFVCYYIDGNTKALWSQNRCYKGKVTMLGRVMNCLENVFIHDGKGHPLYFQTFHGHADIGEHALGMITELTKHFSDVSAKVLVRRILVIDGGGNSVKTMRAFSDKDDEYFITILDDNQVKERKFKHKTRKKSYRFGAATLIECRIELLDSTQKGYIYEARAVVVNWDNGKESVLVTNISAELLEASEIVKRYFDRWPNQEKQFRNMKGRLNIHRIVGYGKKLEDYDSMKEKHSKIKQTVEQLRAKLRDPLSEKEEINKELTTLYRKERKLREKSKIDLGKRVLSEPDSTELEEIERKIDKRLRRQKAIEKKHKEDFAKLKKNMKEEGRIRFKDKIYRIDTELDQIMTCFKLSFANLCSFFLMECMNHERYELVTLFESIFQLGGNARITDREKTIELERNPKEQKVMKKLEAGIKKLNEMKIKNGFLLIAETHVLYFSCILLICILC